MLKDYTPEQLKAFLKPKDVQKEFGIDKDTLAYMRECSVDEGKLRGPMFIPYGPRRYKYKVQWVWDYLNGMEWEIVIRKKKQQEVS